MTDNESGPGGPSAFPLRRRSKRKKVYKGARLVLGGGASTIDCVVRDISVNGARVKVSDVSRLGGALRLVFPDGETLEAEVVREHGLEYGLDFKGGRRPSLAPPSDPAEAVAMEMDSPWLYGLLDQIGAPDFKASAEVQAAADDLRQAYDHLKMLLGQRIGRY